MDKMIQQKMADLEKAKMESYEKAEKRFFENLRLKEMRFE